MSPGVGAELEKLKKLLDEGVLSTAEFEAAKAKLLSTIGPANNTGTGVNLLGKAASRWVSFKIATYIASGVIAVLAIVFLFIPQWQDMKRRQAAFDLRFQSTQSEIDAAAQEMERRRREFDSNFKRTPKELNSSKPSRSEN